MTTALAARWVLTAVFAAAGLTALLPRARRRRRSLQNGGSVVFAA
jgi:hypothetical protein